MHASNQLLSFISANSIVSLILFTRCAGVKSLSCLYLTLEITCDRLCSDKTIFGEENSYTINICIYTFIGWLLRVICLKAHQFLYRTTVHINSLQHSSILQSQVLSTSIVRYVYFLLQVIDVYPILPCVSKKLSLGRRPIAC